MDTLTATLDRAGRGLFPSHAQEQMTPRQVLERVQVLLDPHIATGRSLADELTAERRREAALEGNREALP